MKQRPNRYKLPDHSDKVDKLANTTAEKLAILVTVLTLLVVFLKVVFL